MTGYGEAERDTDAGRLRVEIRTVNHRFFNAQIRTPEGFGPREAALEGWLRERFSRGHVRLSLTLDRAEAARPAATLEVDLDRARRYRKLLEELQQALAIPGEVSLSMLARYSGELFREVEPQNAPEVGDEELRQAVDEAAGAAVAMREAEGVRLQADLEARLEAMAGLLEVIRERAPLRLEAERERLREAIRELTEKDEVDPDRLAREVAYLAEKWDIHEELVRFGSHLELFGEALGSPADEAVGKRLGFLVQEMHREANTIGSKANDPEISAASVGLKEEIERLREQVENVE